MCNIQGAYTAYMRVLWPGSSVTRRGAREHSMRRQRLPLPAIALLIALVLVATAPFQAKAAGADGALAVAALDVLLQEYVESVDPVQLLNAAIAALRKATNLEADALPEIPAGLSRGEAAEKFQEEFAKAVQAGTASETELAYAATREMLASVHDSHVAYLDPDQFKEREQQLAGKPGYQGIGVFVKLMQDEGGASQVFVMDVFPGSPADAAGVRQFDRITRINDAALAANATPKDVTDQLRGPAGSVVTLTVQRGIQTVTMSLVRAPIRIPPVTAQMIRPGVAYVRLLTFSQGVGEQFREALRSLQSRGTIRAVILDLRRNSGGLLREAQSVAGVFLPPQTTLVRVFPRAQPPTVMVSIDAPLLPQEPLVVLTDGGTASAAEVVVEGLRNSRRATIIGEKTAGSEGAARTVPLQEGGMLVTVSRIVGPQDEKIDGVGITPDTPVALTVADVIRGVDTQLDAAVEIVGTLRRLHLSAA